jgi:hypothetical protein
MFMLKPVTAQALGKQTQHLGNHAQPTQTVGLALQELIVQFGNKHFVAVIKRLLVALQTLQIELKVALQTIQGLKDTGKKQELVAMEQLPKQIGFFTQILAY